MALVPPKPKLLDIIPFNLTSFSDPSLTTAIERTLLELQEQGVDLDSIKAKYLFAGVWEETVVGDALDNAEYEHLAEIVGSLVIEQFKGENKQEKYREVINTIFKEWEHNRDK